MFLPASASSFQSQLAPFSPCKMREIPVEEVFFFFRPLLLRWNLIVFLNSLVQLHERGDEDKGGRDFSGMLVCPR